MGPVSGPSVARQGVAGAWLGRGWGVAGRGWGVAGHGLAWLGHMNKGISY